jgi:PAS domain S-box-containing protein
MSEAVRKSGLDIVGDVPWGTHFCQFYRTAQDLLDILIPYFTEGLRHNEFCMWVTSEPLDAEAAKAALAAAVPDFGAYLRKGQIEIIPHSDWYLRGGTFEADRVLDGWVRKLESARAAGFDGLRLTGNTFWLEPRDWRAFTDYEAQIDDVIGKYRMLAVCTYSLDRCGFGEILDVIRNHRFALVRREGRWEFVENGERKRSEESLRASDARFRSLFDHMTEGCALHEIVLDHKDQPVDYRFLDVNEAFERLTGLRREDTVGRLVTEVLPGIEPFWIETYGRVALTGEPATFERYFPKPLDRTYQVSSYRTAPGQFAAIFQDISERKRAEVSLQASREELEVTTEELRQQNDELERVQLELQKREELFRVIASSTPDHVLVQDRDLRYSLVINPQLGLTEKDMIGRTDADFLDPKDARTLTAIKKSVLTMGKPVRVEMPLSSPQGGLEYFEGSYVPRFDAGGRPDGLIGYFRNVTERKRAEEELKRLAQFPGQNPNPVARIGLDGRLIYANPPALDMVQALGGTEIEPVSSALRPLFEEASRSGGVSESDLVDSRGRTFWVAAVLPEGEPYVNVYARDITGRKRAEQRAETGALLLSRVHDAVVGSDPDMRIIYWNKGAENMFGFSETEAVGQKNLDLLRPAYGPGERQRILQELERQGASEAVIRLKRKDDREVVVEAHATRLEAPGTVGYVVVYRDITERIEAEKALQESHEELEVAAEELRQQNEELARVQLVLQRSEEESRRTAEQRQLALDAARLGWWHYDPVTRMAKWDDRYKEIFGVEGHEGLDDEILAEMIHPEDREALWAKVEAALDPAHPQPYAAEYRIIRPDGEMRWVEAYGLAGFETAGGRRRAASFVGTVADITERQRADAALVESRRAALNIMEEALRARDTLRESEERLKRAQEMAHLGSWELDLSNNTLSWSEEVFHIFGLAPERFTATYEAFLNAVHPDDRAAVDEAYARSLRDGRDDYDIEHRIVRADNGEVRTVREKCAHIRDGSGRVVRSVGMVHDISEQKRAEELRKALEEQERLRLGAALEQASDAVIMIDLGGAIRYVNAAFEAINRISRSQAVGRPYFEFVAGDAAAAVAESVRAGRAWRGRIVRKIGEGRAVELEVAISAVKDPKGTIIGGLVTEKDVTQENALQRALRQGQKMEALGTLAGGITHDFNNILGAIIMNTELALLDIDLSHPSREVLPNVLQAANRGKELVKQIITFSRQKEWNRKPVDVGPVVKEAIQFLRSTLPKDVAIHEAVAPDSGAVLGDPSQLNQVVVNLGQNAAQAMRGGGGRLDVRLEPVQVDGSGTARNPDLTTGPYVRLTVADTGSGMSPEVMERIFEPFFTTRGPGEGSGLGLAVVHGIVKGAGGAVTVASEPGKGSVFQVYLPRLEGRIPKTEEAEPPRPAGGRERILLVEDEPAQRESLSRSLERLGYRITARAAGRTALAAFRKEPAAFDVVITDQTMPGMTGLEMAAAMVRARPGIPIILCTGFSDKVEGPRLEHGIVREFVMKPFTLVEITRLIRSVVEKGSSGKPPAVGR